MDKRFQKMITLLSAYAAGDFARRMPLSARLDSTDAIINGIHMLGEELQATTIFRNYFTNIFDSVSDMIFVLSKKGIINDCNRSVCERLGCSREQVVGKRLESLQPVKERVRTATLLGMLDQERQRGTEPFFFRSATGDSFPADITIGYLLDKHKKTAIIVTARDMTHVIQTQNLILQTVISTQEKERQRLAKDIHDSIGQQMSAVKFFISALAETAGSKKQGQVLRRANRIIAGLQSDIRQLCFNLMPKTLEEFGLEKGVRELCNQLSLTNEIRFTIRSNLRNAALTRELQIDAFRIIQEFISNALSHSRASLISIRFSLTRGGILQLSLADDGIGLPQQPEKSKGSGLQNIRYRVKAHSGSVAIHSLPGEGTRFDISFPIT